MSIKESIRACMLNYAVFRGRASRQEFWYFLLGITVLFTGLYLFDYLVLGLPLGKLSPITGLIQLVFLLPILSAGTRRLHDTGFVGWWLLLAFTVIGSVVLLYLWSRPGVAEENIYGAQPQSLTLLN